MGPRIYLVMLAAFGLVSCQGEQPTKAGETKGPAKGYDAGSFNLSSKGWQATIVSIDRPDSADAVMTGRVTDADAKEYCERDPGGETVAYGGSKSVSQCVQKVLQEDGDTQHTASANCIQKTASTGAGRFEYVGMDPDFQQPVWRNSATGQTLDGSSASGAGTIALVFETLCPKTARLWSGEHQ